MTHACAEAFEQAHYDIFFSLIVFFAFTGLLDIILLVTMMIRLLESTMSVRVG